MRDHKVASNDLEVKETKMQTKPFCGPNLIKRRV